MDTVGSNYDTVLAIWTGSRGNLTSVGCNDDIGRVNEVWDPDSKLIINVVAGTTYYIEAMKFGAELPAVTAQVFAHETSTEKKDDPSSGDISTLSGGTLILHLSGPGTAIDVSIGEATQGEYIIPPSGSIRQSYVDVNNGPVKITNTDSALMIAAERVIYNVNGLPTSFSEMMGLPASQLDNTYWMPWYNNVDLDTQLRFGNVSNTPATVQVWIGGQEKTTGCTTTPANVPYPYVLAVGASLRVSCPGLNSGPVQIVSNVNIVAAERVIYKVNNIPTSFTEMMALPDSQLNTNYWLPWYNNVDLDTQLRFGVP
jgi:hypothetical protein